MNLVKTYIDKSPIEGIGLFAAEFIPKGALIWELKEPFDIVLKSEDVDWILNSVNSTCPESTKRFISRYGYEMNGRFVLCGDDARFANHSDDANTQSCFDKQWANRDIQVGEEITCNYSEINDEFNESEFNILKSFAP